MKLLNWFWVYKNVDMSGVSKVGYVCRYAFTYVVAEVTNCEQDDIDYRGHEEIFSEPGVVMNYEEDRSRPKRYNPL